MQKVHNLNDSLTLICERDNASFFYLLRISRNLSKARMGDNAVLMCGGGQD